MYTIQLIEQSQTLPAADPFALGLFVGVCIGVSLAYLTVKCGGIA